MMLALLGLFMMFAVVILIGQLLEAQWPGILDSPHKDYGEPWSSPDHR